MMMTLKLMSYTGGNFADDIKPTKSEEKGLKGENVMLSCDYTVSAFTLLWYRQYPRSAPEFLVLTANTAGDDLRSDVDHRISVRVNEEKTQVSLQISSVQVSDSALYYCALRPTVTQNHSLPHKNMTVTEGKTCLCITINLH